MGRENGVINRFRLRMEEKIQGKRPQQEETSSQSSIAEPSLHDKLLKANNPSNKNHHQTTSASSMEKLKELIEMRKEGYLTEAEFEAGKKKLLGL